MATVGEEENLDWPPDPALHRFGLPESPVLVLLALDHQDGQATEGRRASID